MKYSAADTIAYRLSKMNPCRLDESTRNYAVPIKECWFCHFRSWVNDAIEHDPECLWLNARQYVDLLNAGKECVECGVPIQSAFGEACGNCERAIAASLSNAPVASQEAQESPIESRVSELLGEREYASCQTFEPRIAGGTCMNCGVAGRIHA